MVVVMNEAEPVVLGTSGDDEVGCGHGDSFAASRPSHLAGAVPDIGRRGDGFDLFFQLSEKPVVFGAAGAIPQLDTHHVAEHGAIVRHDFADSGLDDRITVRPERLDPG